MYSPYYSVLDTVKEFTCVLYETQADVVEYKYQTRKRLWGSRGSLEEEEES